MDDKTKENMTTDILEMVQSFEQAIEKVFSVLASNGIRFTFTKKDRGITTYNCYGQTIEED